jgi:hypothetical protein
MQQRVPGSILPGVKRSELEADRSLPSSASFKNAWKFIAPSIRRIGVLAQEEFYFLSFLHSCNDDVFTTYVIEHFSMLVYD